MIKRISDNKILLTVLILVLLAFCIGFYGETGISAYGANEPYVTSSAIHANGTAVLIADGVGYNSYGNLLSRIYFGYNGSGALDDPTSYDYCFVDSPSTVEIEFSAVAVNGSSVLASSASSYDLSAFTVYGGSYNTRGDVNSVGNTYVTVCGGSVLNVYGGSLGGSITGITNVLISGGTVGSTRVSGNVFGGSEEGVLNGYTNVTITGNARIIGDVYGGGNTATAVVYGTTNVNISSDAEIYNSVYGGGNIASVYGKTVISMNGGFVGTEASNGAIFGGGNIGAVFGSTSVSTSGTSKVYGNVFGGGNSIASTVNGSGDGDYAGAYSYVSVAEDSEIIGSVFGGGNAGSHIDYIDPLTYIAYPAKTQVVVSGGTVSSVFGGGMSGAVSLTDVQITGGTVTSVYGGGSEGVVTSTNVTVDGSAVVSGAVYGGGYGGINGGDVSLSTAVTINGGTVASVYGGGYLGDVVGTGTSNPATTTVTVSGGTVSGNIFGGGYLQGATIGTSDSFPGETNVIVSGGNVTNVYGGGGNDVVFGDTNVTVSGGVANNIYGGGLQGYVENVTITINGGSINSVNAKHYINGEKFLVVDLTSDLNFSGVLGTRNSDGTTDGITSFNSGNYNLISTGNITDGSVLAYFQSQSLLEKASEAFMLFENDGTYFISQNTESDIFTLTTAVVDTDTNFPILITLSILICAFVIFAYFILKDRFGK